MKKLLVILLFSPLAGFSQCPEWIGEPLKNSFTLLSLIEQRLSVKFTDTSISYNRERLVFNDSAAKFILKITAVQDTVQSINFEAPPLQMQMFIDWFESAFLECATSKQDRTIVFPGFVVVTAPADEPKKYFYISKKND